MNGRWLGTLAFGVVLAVALTVAPTSVGDDDEEPCGFVQVGWSVTTEDSFGNTSTTYGSDQILVECTRSVGIEDAILLGGDEPPLPGQGDDQSDTPPRRGGSRSSSPEPSDVPRDEIECWSSVVTTARGDVPEQGRYNPPGHPGIDIQCDPGDPILAASAGWITQAENHPVGGNHVRIRHVDRRNQNTGTQTYYAHLHEFADGVERNRCVTQGQRLGTCGSTGQSTGPHLHFEVRVGDDGDPVDPQKHYDGCD